jgi:hypothetical protein
MAEIRPFIIAGCVFLLLLVGSRFAVGYYAIRAAKQTMADTVPKVDSSKPSEPPAAVSFERLPQTQ